MKDHYKTLETGTQASLQEIKTAYRRLARLYHPDKNQDTERAKEYFQEIQEAYAVLSDPARRRTYDMNCVMPDNTSGSKNQVTVRKRS